MSHTAAYPLLAGRDRLEQTRSRSGLTLSSKGGRLFSSLSHGDHENRRSFLPS